MTLCLGRGHRLQNTIQFLSDLAPSWPTFWRSKLEVKVSSFYKILSFIYLNMLKLKPVCCSLCQILEYIIFFCFFERPWKEITFRFSISKSMLALFSRLLLSLAFRFFGRHMTRLRNWMCIHSFRMTINVIAKLNSSRKGYSLFLIIVSYYNLHEMWSFFYGSIS